VTSLIERTMVGVFAALFAFSTAVLAQTANAPDPDALFQDLVVGGNGAALVTLTHHFTLAEISNRLKAMPRRAVAVSSGSMTPLAARSGRESAGSYTSARMVFDSTGVLHVVFNEAQFGDSRNTDGTTRMASHKLYYLRREQETWLRPVLIPHEESDHIPDVELLLGEDDTVFLFAQAYVTRQVGGERHRISNVFLWRLSKGGQWSAQEACIPRPPRLLHSFDVCFDRQKRLHLVWGHWLGNDVRESLHHRIWTAGQWGEEETLTGHGERNLMFPRIRLVGEKLHVFADGQTPDYQTIGTYHLTLGLQRPGGWTEPRLVADQNQSFQHLASRRGEPFLLAVHARSEDGNEVWKVIQLDAQQQTRPSAKFIVPGPLFTTGYDSSPESLALAPDREIYRLINRGGDIYLLRGSEDGITAAICVAAAPTVSSSLDFQPQLMVRGERFHTLWVTGAGSASTLNYYEGPIPQMGWRPLSELVWTTRPGSGLNGADRSWLREKIFSEARQSEERANISDAVERYIYLLASFDEGGQEVFQAKARLDHLWQDRRYIAEVRRHLWASVERDPSVFTRETFLGRQLRDLFAAVEIQHWTIQLIEWIRSRICSKPSRPTVLTSS
jgi:hypothetical protein